MAGKAKSVYLTVTTMDHKSVFHRMFFNAKQYNDMLTWCLEHCQSKFRDMQESKGRAWYFQNEQDAVMFAMKWA